MWDLRPGWRPAHLPLAQIAFFVGPGPVVLPGAGLALAVLLAAELYPCQEGALEPKTGQSGDAGQLTAPLASPTVFLPGS